ncbi:MAG: hypothetical protein V4722_27570 [Bacteroidota bacterium]
MLRFISKLAFLGNIAFAVVFAMHWIKGIEKWDQALVSHLVITAYFIAVISNLVVNVWTLVLLIRRKPVPIARWLQVANALFLILQMIYFQYT